MQFLTHNPDLVEDLGIDENPSVNALSQALGRYTKPFWIRDCDWIAAPEHERNYFFVWGQLLAYVQRFRLATCIHRTPSFIASLPANKTLVSEYRLALQKEGTTQVYAFFEALDFTLEKNHCFFVRFWISLSRAKPMVDSKRAMCEGILSALEGYRENCKDITGWVDGLRAATITQIFPRLIEFVKSMLVILESEKRVQNHSEVFNEEAENH